MSRALVLGDGQIGSAVADAFRRDGWKVVVARRTVASVEPDLLEDPYQRAVVDREDFASLKRVVNDGFDAVIDTIAFNAGHARQWLELQSSVGTLVVISSGSVYSDAARRTLDEARISGFPDYPVPIREDQTRASPGDATYSSRKVDMEDVLLNNARIPVSVLRPFAVYGPKSRSPREWWFLVRALAGQVKIPLSFEGRSQFHTSATANIAELCRIVARQPGSRALNAADPQALTVAEIGQAIFDVRGQPVTFDRLAGRARGMTGLTPWTVERPVIADMSAALSLGYRPVTDYRHFVAETCAALLKAADGKDWREVFPELSGYPSAMFEPEDP